MEAYTKPIDKLREALRWFIAVPELQLLHVAVSLELRESALREIIEAQAQQENRAAIFFFTTPAEDDPNEWSERCEELSESFEVFAEEAAKGQPPFALRPLKPSHGQGPEGFLLALRNAVEAVDPAAQG